MVVTMGSCVAWAQCNAKCNITDCTLRRSPGMAAISFNSSSCKKTMVCELHCSVQTVLRYSKLQSLEDLPLETCQARGLLFFTVVSCVCTGSMCTSEAVDHVSVAGTAGGACCRASRVSASVSSPEELEVLLEELLLHGTVRKGPVSHAKSALIVLADCDGRTQAVDC